MNKKGKRKKTFVLRAMFYASRIGCVKNQRRSTSRRFLVSFVFCLAIFLPSVQAQPRAFSTCEALADGLNSSVIQFASEPVRAFCQRFDEADDDESKVIIVEGEELTLEEFSTVEGVAITTSSIDTIPLTVIGGNEKSSATKDRGISTRESDNRPAGVWFTIVTVDVRDRASAVWSVISELENLFSIGFLGFGRVEQTKNEKSVRVVPANGAGIVFTEVDRDDDDFFVIVEFTYVARTAFPGFNFEGSRLYIQVLSKGSFFRQSTSIELGWQPPSDFDIDGDLDAGTRLMESLLFQISANFEGEFGRRCDFGRNVRTIEGDCNNLDDLEQGAANGPLRRLGKPDPAYPKGDRSVFSGPTQINVREISNALFSTSPGASILEEQAEKLEKLCIPITKADGTENELCPLKFIRINPEKESQSVIDFSGFKTNENEELVFQYESKSCSIDVLLKCSGESRVELAADPCGAKTNRFFDPVGCVRQPADDGVLANSDGLTDLFITFGQFIDHDYGLSPLSQISRDQPAFSRLSLARDIVEEISIEVPENDFHFQDRDEFEFTRTQFSEDDPKSHVNLHSSYLDGSQIYGTDFQRARLLRSFNGGKLKVSSENLPPFNKVDGEDALGAIVENAPNQDDQFFVVGDTRGNEQSLLLALHILFLREHNLVAEEIAKEFPLFDEELLYQTARAIVIAEYQCIIYNEWLPLLLGLEAPDPKDFEYDEDLDATVSSIFTTAAFRFGHSMIGTNLLTMGPGTRDKADLSLLPVRRVFFQPKLISNLGVDAFIRGGAWHVCKEMDNYIVDELRNFLVIEFEIGVTSPPRFDLISFNLQRGRDMGLPSFNDVRELFDLEKYKTFSEFVKNPNLADAASQIYEGDVDQVDLFFGGVVEEHERISQLGETFTKIIADQFRRSRDGDRFFYAGIEFSTAFIARMPRIRRITEHKVRLADIILRNTEITRKELGKRSSVFRV